MTKTPPGSLIASLSTQHPWFTLFSSLILIALIASGAPNLEFSNNYRVFFSDENPELTQFENFQDTYTKNDNILIVLHPVDGKLFIPEKLAAIEALTEKAWHIPYVSRVDSITNFQHSAADGDDLLVDNLVVDPLDMSMPEAERIGLLAHAEPLLSGSLLAKDKKTTAINITLQYPEKSLLEVPESVEAVRAITGDFEAQHPEFEVYLTGLSMLNNAFGETGQKDAATLMPLMFLMLLLMIFVVLRSFSMILGTLVVILLSMIGTMGFAGHIGIKLTPVSIMAPIIVMTLAIADSVHILINILELMREGKSRMAAIVESIEMNFQPVTITSFTTLAGFLALNYSDAPPFQHLGNMAAFGIFIAWLSSIFTLPAVMTLLRFRAKESSANRFNTRIIDATARLVTHHHKPVLVATSIISLVFIALISRNIVDDSFVSYFDKSIEFRADTEFTVNNLTGIYQVEYSLPAEGEGGINQPRYLRHLSDFTDWLRKQPEVGHVYSYSDIIKRLNKNMHGDDPSWYRIPDDNALAAQYLLMYEFSLPFGLDLNDRISADKSATRLTVNLGDLSTYETRQFLDRADDWLKTHVPEYMQAQPTGATVMFSYIFKRNTESMLTGNVIVILVITLLLMIALKSWRFGLLSMIPNTIPILITFGIWGLLVGKVGLASASVSAAALGIIVDDTIHFLTKYLRARRQLGYDQYQSVHYAFHMVGKALLANSLILIAGFSVLAFSAFKINGETGLLTATAIATALIMDFLLLPALLMTGYKRKSCEKAETACLQEQG